MNVENLKKLMSLGLTTEQMAGVIDVLAVELEPLEAMRADAELRRSKDKSMGQRGAWAFVAHRDGREDAHLPLHFDLRSVNEIPRERSPPLGGA